MSAKESAVAKSTGQQKIDDLVQADRAFYRVLIENGKLEKRQARYRIQEKDVRIKSSCVKCKFNLGDEGKCLVVGGKINNEYGISKYFSPKGDGMLPGDIVWEYVKAVSKKLPYKDGYVIKEGAPGFQCKDCKYYLYSHDCLLIEGEFKPKMSCGYVVKIGHGTKV
jgi:hypothetical protein